MIRLLIFLITINIFAVACNNSGKKPENETKPMTTVDSLIKDIDKGHMDGMGKIGRLHNTRKKVQALLDSLVKLPSRSDATTQFIENLRTNIKDLDYADMAMDKWMNEYDEDSAIDNVDQRILYLGGEKIKVDNLSSAIRTSLYTADSLLKVKL